MGRHETFKNATPIAEDMLAGTMLAGISKVASNDLVRGETSVLALIATARGNLLMADAEAAFALARRRYEAANDLADRAGLTRVRIPR